MKVIPLSDMTLRDFKKLPLRKWDKESIYDSLVILPQRRVHDSGYRMMEFVGTQFVRKTLTGIERVSGCSDVIHFDGIGGYGDDWFKRYGKVPDMIPVHDWCIDCLRVSGAVNIFLHRHRIKVGGALSSLNIYAVNK